MRHKIIILGAAGHGAVAAEAAELAGHEVIGFVADKPTSGLRLLGSEANLPELLDRYAGSRLFIAIGDNDVRRRAVQRLAKAVPAAEFVAIVHPSACVSPRAKVGRGAFVGAGAVVATGAEIGAFAIMNTRASLDHHAYLGDFSSMAPASATGGRARIGSGSAIGMGAIVHQNVVVGDDTVLGSLSLANKDIPAAVIAIGQPARVVTSRKPGEKYL